MLHAEIAGHGSVEATSVSITQPRPARLGAIIAAAICGVIAIGGWAFEPDGGQTFGLLGLPAATVLGYRLAGRVLAADRQSAAVVGSAFAIGAVLITDALVVLAMVGEFMADSFEQQVGRDVVALGAQVAADVAIAVPTALFLYIIGALIVGVPVLFLTVPAAMAWAILVRFLADRGLAR